MKKIQIKTPSRLHFGLIDLNGELGRVDGGIGVALKEPNVIVSVEFNKKLEIIGGTDRADEIQNIIDKIDKINKIQNNFNKKINTRNIKKINNNSNIKNFNTNTNINTKIKFNIKNQVPAHSGLGSTTQLLLAAAKAVTELNGISLSAEKLSELIGRGGTSGIGTAVFDYGGFILDGGHSFGVGKEKDSFLPSSASRASPAPVIARCDIPENWYFVIIIPEVKSKIYGQHEVNIFQKYCPIPSQDVEKLSRLILMKILPSVIENDIESFGSGLTKMQNIGFKKIEVAFQDEIIVKLMENLNKISFGSGMSSFGPTIYALTDGKKHAEEVANKTKEFLMDSKVNFEIFITSANNSGADIEYN